MLVSDFQIRQISLFNWEKILIKWKIANQSRQFSLSHLEFFFASLRWWNYVWKDYRARCVHRLIWGPSSAVPNVGDPAAGPAELKGLLSGSNTLPQHRSHKLLHRWAVEHNEDQSAMLAVHARRSLHDSRGGQRYQRNAGDGRQSPAGTQAGCAMAER